ncbi:FRG domain-containing protein, partial [Priestia megaterium]
MSGLQAYKWIESEINQYRKQQNMSPDDILWYRGEYKDYPKLVSSMMRNVIGANPPNKRLDFGEKVEIKLYEKWIYENFSEHVTFTHPEGHVHQGLKSWDMVYYLQHYGMNTRFLDWTEELAVSIYFAGKKAKPGLEATIWLLNPVMFNKYSIGREYITTPVDTYGDLVSLTVQEGTSIKPAALSAYKPSTINERIYRQTGYF